jgi:hypothetical protein
MRQMQQIAVRPGRDASSVLVTNHAGHGIGSLTLLLPHDIEPDGISWDGAPPAGCRAWRDWLAVWGNVPPRTTIRVQWITTGHAA